MAAEVKQLATQTTRATEKIATLVQAIQDEPGHSVEAIGAIGETIAAIAQFLDQIAAAVHEQGAASEEIARNVTAAAEGTQDVAGTITDIARESASTTVAADTVQRLSRLLSEHNAELNEEARGFIACVRAA